MNDRMWPVAVCAVCQFMLPKPQNPSAADKNIADSRNLIEIALPLTTVVEIHLDPGGICLRDKSLNVLIG